MIPNYKPTITKKDLENVLDSLIDDDLLTGNISRSLEANFAAFIQRKYALTFNSANSAFYSLWKGLNLQATDEVIIPSYYSPVTLSSLRLFPAQILILDFDKEGFYYNEELLLEKVGNNSKVVLIPHLYGDIRFFEKIPILKKKYPQLIIIEDVSHSLGGIIHENGENYMSGMRGDIVFCSLSDDSIITTGGGALLATDQHKWLQSWNDLRNFRHSYANIKRKKASENETMEFFDMQMADFQAALGITQLKNLQKFNERRKEIAELYRKVLVRTKHKFLTISEQPVSHKFPVVLDTEAEPIITRAKKQKIDILYQSFYPLHGLLQLPKEEFRSSERLFQRLIEIPIYPHMRKRDVEQVIEFLSSIPG